MLLFFSCFEWVGRDRGDEKEEDAGRDTMMEELNHRCSILAELLYLPI